LLGKVEECVELLIERYVSCHEAIAPPY